MIPMERDMAEIVTVPLSKLTASDANMRKTARDSGVEELAVNLTGTAAGQVLGAAAERSGNGELLKRQVEDFLGAVRST
jgi:ParB family transcriptional regulator, chromosome partitioning protein